MAWVEAVARRNKRNLSDTGKLSKEEIRKAQRHANRMRALLEYESTINADAVVDVDVTRAIILCQQIGDTGTASNVNESM